MRDDRHDVECDALDMIKRFGYAGVYIARELAETAEGRQGHSAQVWHDIVDEIDRLSLKL